MHKTLLTGLSCVAIVLMAGCQKQEKFVIDGTIPDAQGKTVYLDRMGASQTTTIDSVRLGRTGKFRFSQPREEYPDLYRLRADGKVLVIAIDSTEQVHITSTLDSLPYHAKVEGSEKTEQITELRRSLQEESMAEHKRKAATVILTEPRSIVAYYALLQHKGGQFVFNLSDKADRMYFSAVATAWNVFMPNSERGRKLYGTVEEEIQNERKSAQLRAVQTLIKESDNAFLDINLPDEKGIERKLSALRGKVILLDFSAIGMPQSQAYIFELRDLYNRYHTEGLEIYQVSSDTDTVLWAESAMNLPWVTVHSDKDNASCYRTYNVQRIPTHFLLNRKGEVTGRNIPFDQLPKRIEECLR